MELDILRDLQERGRFFWEMFPGAQASDEWHRQRGQIERHEEKAAGGQSSPPAAVDAPGEKTADTLVQSEGAIDSLNRRQWEWLPETRAEPAPAEKLDHPSAAAGTAEAKRPKPTIQASGTHPRECLLELISGNGVESWDWASQSIGMVRGDCEFPAKVGGDVWPQ
jgi:hypothetical protein